LVSSKGGDTIKIQTFTPQTLPQNLKNEYTNSINGASQAIQYKLVDSATIQQYRIQAADGILPVSKTAVEICLGLIGYMVLFMGFMSIAEKAGGINLLSRWMQPFFSKLFPEVPQGHASFGHMTMNFAANLLGLDNAATPFGLKAMESLQTLNPSKTIASNAQIMFLALHASGLTLIPVSIIAARASIKPAALNPTDIFIPCMLATFVATVVALILVSVKQKINVLQPSILAYIASIALVFGGLVWYLSGLPTADVDSFSKLLSNSLILFIFGVIILGGLYKKINLFDAFVEGAKNGFDTCVRIIPYLVAMLVAISLLRNSGVFDAVISSFKYLFASINCNTQFVDALPTALIKPLSGSGARGMMIDTMKTFGADSFAGRLSCIFQGSSDTTFYVLAVYFGAVGIKNTRYSIGVMLLADLAGILASIGVCYLFFK
jgi:spore maturation protein SpmA